MAQKEVLTATAYNPIHSSSNWDHDDQDENHDLIDANDDDDNNVHTSHKSRHHSTKKEIYESFDFTDVESMMWRKHQFRRFFQNKGRLWTSSRSTTAWRWLLVILTGLLVGVTGCFVSVLTSALMKWKLDSCYQLVDAGNFGGAFFAYQFLSMFLVLCAGALCWWEPAAAGSGIPEIKAYLNGVNISHVVRRPVMIAKVIGMCFSVSSGLPLGKEGPMIHVGSIIGAALSQGINMPCGFDTSWNIFQDLRNDRTSRDFVTFGAAAGVAAAFRAPIGGILFTLEEGASFWSTTTTFRAFICAVITQLTVSVVFAQDSETNAGLFALGQFENFYNGKPNFKIFEIPIFIIIGCVGGLLGALFNHINEQISIYRKKHLNAFKKKRIIELVLITLAMSFISFILPLMWQVCTNIPLEYEEESSTFTAQELSLLEELVPFQCEPHTQYNQLASLYFTSGEVAMRQLFHFRENDGFGNDSFTSGPLILFFIPYFLIAAITSGVLAPAGLFVPTLLAGAAFGRLLGHWLNLLGPGTFADSGTYALIGAAAVLGGMARMTVAGTVIMLEACGNITYLLPLMVTFAASRYVGNAFNEPMYDMQIHLKDMPFLEGTLHTLGMLNYHPISEIMASPVITLMEVEKVRRVMDVLTNTVHNGFPVVNKDGRLRGIVLRKTLCGLLKLKAYSTPTQPSTIETPSADGGIVLAQAATVMFDNLERVYPNFPDVKQVKLSEKELVRKYISQLQFS